MSRYTRDLRPTITFHDRDGNFAGKVKVRETGGRGTKHFNIRRPDGPPCTEPGCAESWAPVCPNTACPGNTTPRRMMRVERYGLRRNEREAMHRGR